MGLKSPFTLKIETCFKNFSMNIFSLVGQIKTEIFMKNYKLLKL